jgi:hypothetical protein
MGWSLFLCFSNFLSGIFSEDLKPSIIISAEPDWFWEAWSQYALQLHFLFLNHDLEWMWELVFSKECWQGYLVHSIMKDLYCTELRTLWAFVANFKIRATGFAHFARPPLQKIHILLGVMSGEYFACWLQMKSWRPSMCKHSFFL